MNYRLPFQQHKHILYICSDLFSVHSGLSSYMTSFFPMENLMKHDAVIADTGHLEQGLWECLYNSQGN